ncbi:MAG: carboxypeptidase regulatory-like domain-containing protein [Chloroflexi bacterium]|nr:carboxypeptidase regulatory-like domain-containing protein [Chloroflexota bacterium]
MRHITRNLGWWGGVALLAALLAVTAACKAGPAGPAGPAGTAGPAGPAAKNTGTVAGKVINSLTKAPVAGVAVTTVPAIAGVTITSGADGAFTAELPIGNYTLTFKKANFKDGTDTAAVAAGQKVTVKDTALQPLKPVAVTIAAPQPSAPGASVALKATVEPLDGSTVSSIEWKQVSGTVATLDKTTGDAVNAKLGNEAAYKGQLIKSLKFEDRFGVVGINPHALSSTTTAVFQATVKTSSGTYSGMVNVVAKLPYKDTLGIANVPVGVPVLVHAKNQPAFAWSIAGPSGSQAKVDTASDQNAVFTPDVAGKYTLTETRSGAKLDVTAGTWAGAITGIGADGKPLSAGCTTCHNGTVAADKFKDWKLSGHAEIFTQNINDPNGHWAINCAQCHTVGYDPDAKNNGFDEAVAAEGWKVPPHGDVGLWPKIAKEFPKTASLANIQCENCHGPNNSALHANGKIDAERVSISSETCGSCHGEPLRHGRFQQWEESGHANFELAIDEATVENRGATAAHCGRCHSGQGFLSWSKQGDLTKQIQGKSGNATVDELKAMGLTKDIVQPQTCAVCHEPHNPGSITGEPNNATVRIMGSTSLLPAGYKAEHVGKGALCITCHNTRNGAHNDSKPPTNYSAPHTAAQGDVLMGENAYLVAESQRSPHSFLENTCVTCHMNATPPPAEFSYNLAGTNHSFKASPEICADCHTKELNGEAFKEGGEAKLEKLGKAMSDYLLKKLPSTRVYIKDYTPHNFNNKFYDVKSDQVIVDRANILGAEPFEPHGQQGFIFKFKTPVTVTYKPANEAAHTVQMSEVEIQLGDISPDGANALFAPTDTFVKVGWNFWLIHGDGSGGIHNPLFTQRVIDASIQALR